MTTRAMRAALPLTILLLASQAPAAERSGNLLRNADLQDDWLTLVPVLPLRCDSDEGGHQRQDVREPQPPVPNHAHKWRVGRPAA